MVRPEPVFHRLAQVLGQRDHLASFLFRGRAINLVVAKVPLLTERVELRHQFVVRADSVFEAQNDAVMMRVTRGLIAAGRQSCDRALQRGIVGDRQAGVIAKAFGLAIAKITVGHAEQVGDLLPAGLVRPDPLGFKPIG